MKKGIKFGGLISAFLLIGAIVFYAWFSPMLQQKLSELNDSVLEKSEDTPIGKPFELPSEKQPQTIPEAERTYLALGNPSRAIANPLYVNNYLSVNKFFALSYNNERAIPNWVAWRLTKNDIGRTSRQNDFRPDGDLPSDFKEIYPSYYSRSGYDRGHIVPSADRTRSREANSSTFVMSNMTPQTPDLNQGPWEKLERYSRSMARRKNDLFIYSGCYGEKEKLRRKVSVPTNCWKIIVAVQKGSQIDGQTRVIAVDMPNIRGIKEKNWRDYKTSVRNIEDKTGYNFLSVLAKDLQDVLETKVDTR